MIKINSLTSGILLVTEKIPYVQSVAMGIWVKAGSVDEVAEHAGISHFVEHMSFKGTNKRNARQIAEDIDKIGGQINAFTGREATCYYVKTIENNWKKAADVLTDMIEDSVFSEEEMNRERKVICEEIKMTLDSPEDLAQDTIIALCFDGTDLGKSIIGTPQTLDSIDRKVITEYVENGYTRDKIVISVSGNFDEEELIKYFETKLTNRKAKGEPRPVNGSGYTPLFKTIKKDIEQTHVCLATRSIKNTDPTYYAFSILNNIMGGSMSSRFFQNIREEKGLAYSVYSMNSSYTDDGYYNIYAGISHDKVEDVIHAIDDELKLLKKEGVTKEELESSREQLKSAYIFGLENISGRMFRNGKNVLLNNRIYTEEEVIDGLDKVTFEDIEAVKGMICDLSTYSAALVTSKDSKKDIEKIIRG